MHFWTPGSWTVFVRDCSNNRSLLGWPNPRNLEWWRERTKKTAQVVQKHDTFSRWKQLARLRFVEDGGVRVRGATAVATAANGTVSGKRPNESLLGAIIHPTAICCSWLILNARPYSETNLHFCSTLKTQSLVSYPLTFCQNTTSEPDPMTSTDQKASVLISACKSWKGCYRYTQ